MLNSAKIRYAGIFAILAKISIFAILAKISIFAILAKISIFAMHSYFGYDSEISLS